MSNITQRNLDQASEVFKQMSVSAEQAAEGSRRAFSALPTTEEALKNFEANRQKARLAQAYTVSNLFPERKVMVKQAIAKFQQKEREEIENKKPAE